MTYCDIVNKTYNNSSLYIQINARFASILDLYRINSEACFDLDRHAKLPKQRLFNVSRMTANTKVQHLACPIHQDAVLLSLVDRLLPVSGGGAVGVFFIFG